MEQIGEVNKVLEQIVQDIENNNLDERTYKLNNKNINMDSTINKDLQNAFKQHEKMGIYMFAYKDKNKLHFLKIGKANSRSAPRFYNQHYSLNAATSTLARHLYFSIQSTQEWKEDRIRDLSEKDKFVFNKIKNNDELKNILKDVKEFEEKGKTKFEYDIDILRSWMKNNLVRINIILDKDLNSFVLNYFEAYLHLKFKPLYEGPINQKH